MNVHLLPKTIKQSQQNFLDTVTNHSINCKTEKIKKFHPNIIKNNNHDSYPIWGVTNGGNDRNKKQWEKMKPNDIGVFYKDKKFDNYCLILDKFNNKEFALQLWGEKFNKALDIYETWENLFLIKDLKEIDIPIDTYNDCFGHSQNNKIQGYTRLDDDKSELFLDAFDFIEVGEQREVRLTTESRGINPSGRLVKHKDGEIDTSSSKRTEREIVIEQKEMLLVKRFKKYLETNNQETLHRYKFNPPNESTILETDGWIVETKTLIEAKATPTRSNIRMAIGQLMDYRRHHSPKPEKLAILLPSCPRKDLVNLIFSMDIEIIFEKENEFKTIRKE